MIEQFITSSILIASILAISFLMKKRLGPCIRYALWLLAAVKLLAPIPEFESPLSVMNAAGRIEERDVQYLFADSTIEENHDNGYDSGKEKKEETVNRSLFKKTDFAGTVYMIWIVGVLLCAGVFLRSNLRFYFCLKNSRKRVGQVKKRLDVYEAAGIGSPCLFGFFKPSVYFPKDCKLSEKQREFVLAHEYTHYRHGDHVWALVRCLCVIFYWYHPLVWTGAQKSVRDSEAAADAGTLRIIGNEKGIAYGKTLIAVAKEMPDQTERNRVLTCSTGAAGGMRAMKERMKMIVNQPQTKMITVFVLALLCACTVGCTFTGAVKEGQEHADASETEENATVGEEEESAAAGAGEEKSTEAGAGEESATAAENDTAENENGEDLPPEEEKEAGEIAVLYRQPEADKVCIRVEPSLVREDTGGYYIPEGRYQEGIQRALEKLPPEGEPYAKRWEGRKETGWRIAYKNVEIMALEGGYLYYLYVDDEKGDMEYFTEASELCDYIQTMLQDKLGYYPFHPADIRDIVSATLEVRSIFTDYQFYRQTITDRETLEKFEDWFSNAEYIFGGAECGNSNSSLQLFLADGKNVRLSVATDSCPNFGINGVYYDYRPEPVWDNREFFECFDEIPWEWTKEFTKDNEK
ncbi:MAG: M56 family metallopeptidase [Lachnospiraceae bacterium]|nr:M56 family metallopeptidase [Lachnospiraceae bacterium]